MQYARRKSMVLPLVQMARPSRTTRWQRKGAIYGITSARPRQWLRHSVFWWLKTNGLSNGWRGYTLRCFTGGRGLVRKYAKHARFVTPWGTGLSIWGGRKIYWVKPSRGLVRGPSHVLL